MGLHRAAEPVQDIEQELTIIVVAAIHAEFDSQRIHLRAEKGGFPGDNQTATVHVERERLQMPFRCKADLPRLPIVGIVTQQKQRDRVRRHRTEIVQ